MGREFMGIIRSTFLIDKKGRIVKIWEECKSQKPCKRCFKNSKIFKEAP